MIICNIIVIPNKKPRFQKEFIWRGQGYDCKWDFISNTKYNSSFIFFWKAERKTEMRMKETQDSKEEEQKTIEMKINYNSKREDLEEKDQRQDERNVIL